MDKKKNKDLQDMNDYTKGGRYMTGEGKKSKEYGSRTIDPKTGGVLYLSRADQDRNAVNNVPSSKMSKSDRAYQKSYIAKGEKASETSRQLVPKIAALDLMKKKKYS